MEDQLQICEGARDVDHRLAMQVGKHAHFKFNRNAQNHEQNVYQERLTKKEKKRFECSRCLENGREAHECYKLHGHPN